MSRKGFDSCSGGCPSPIFSDGKILSLPIPDHHSPISYQSIKFRDGHLGNLVEDLTGGRVSASDGVHLDPDVNPASLMRKSGWLPLFGQMGSAQGHLSRQGVGEGDLFLYFGVFRAVERVDGRWRFKALARPQHRIWGWFQVGSYYPARELPDDIKAWAEYHPHCYLPVHKNNRLYIASEKLTINGKELEQPGAGCFRKTCDSYLLSASDSAHPSVWLLPGWFYPGLRKRPLSYHRNMQRWKLNGKRCYLSSVFRGQEFVLHCEDYPQAPHWAARLISKAAF